MLRNYLKVAFRTLMKNKVFSLINIVGLSVGLCCCIFITLYLINEWSYDKYHKNAPNLYQVGTIFSFEKDPWATTPSPLGEGFKREFPEVEDFARLRPLLSEAKTLIQFIEQGVTRSAFYEERGFVADASFFRLFTYDFIEGDAATALTDPLSVVITEDIARKIFGNQPALNKVIQISSSTNGDNNYTVRGVFRPMNAPSHIDGRFFMSMTGGKLEAFNKDHVNDYATHNLFFTYLLLRPGSNIAGLEAKFPAFLDKYAADKLKTLGFTKKQFLTHVPDIHLRSEVINNVTPAGSKTSLYVLACIALFTLLIACINFMNLSTARSAKRSTEVGIRKVLGSERRSLIFQFLAESLLMSLVAFLFAIIMVLLFMPTFELVTNKDISFSWGRHLPIALAFLGMAALTGLIAGSYPAFYLSSFMPVQVLKGKFKTSMSGILLRRGLVVFQFIISGALIFSTVVISNQMHFMRSKDLGFEKTGQIIVPLRSEKAKEHYLALKNEFRRAPQVIDVGASLYNPGVVNLNEIFFYGEGRQVEDAQRTKMNYVDADYLQTMGIKPVAGRLFSEKFPADTNGRVVLNENAIRSLGFASAQEAVGKQLYSDWKGNTNKYEIVGVVKDFHFEALHLPIAPFGFELRNQFNFNTLVVHARADQISALLKSLESSWRTLNPSEPFEYSFLSEDFQRNYQSEERTATLIRYFTVMAIIISCLGLFGLASFSAEQRLREIGIRKTLGASTTGIVVLLSRDFLKLVGIALIIAAPLAWYFMQKWLQGFAYRVPISWLVFLITFLVVVFVALITIGTRTLWAALANPVKSLKSE